MGEKKENRIPSSVDGIINFFMSLPGEVEVLGSRKETIIHIKNPNGSDFDWDRQVVVSHALDGEVKSLSEQPRRTSDFTYTTTLERASLPMVKKKKIVKNINKEYHPRENRFSTHRQRMNRFRRHSIHAKLRGS